MEAFFAGPGEGEVEQNEVRRHRFLGELPHLEVLDSTFEASFEVDPHTHADHTDTFFVLEGEGEFLVNGEWRRGGPGTFLSVPPGVEHGFRNPGPGPLRVLNIHAPKVGFNERIRSA